MPRYLYSKLPYPLTAPVQPEARKGGKAPKGGRGATKLLTIIPGRNPRPAKGKQKILFSMELFDKVRKFPQIARRLEEGYLVEREEAEVLDVTEDTKLDGLIGEEAMSLAEEIAFGKEV